MAKQSHKVRFVWESDSLDDMTLECIMDCIGDSYAIERIQNWADEEVMFFVRSRDGEVRNNAE